MCAISRYGPNTGAISQHEILECKDMGSMFDLAAGQAVRARLYAGSPLGFAAGQAVHARLHAGSLLKPPRNAASARSFTRATYTTPPQSSRPAAASPHSTLPLYGRAAKPDTCLRPSRARKLIPTLISAVKSAIANPCEVLRNCAPNSRGTATFFPCVSQFAGRL